MTASLVVASNRPEALYTFMEHWAHPGYWHDLIVVIDAARDNPVWSNLDVRHGEQVYFHEDFGALAGARAWIFSRGSSACKCFGFLKAIERGADLVVVLDDDCLPVQSDGEFVEPNHTEIAPFIRFHNHCLTDSQGWVSTVPEVGIRGLPYGSWGRSGQHSLVHMGLWTGFPDIDAVHQLAAYNRGEQRTWVPGNLASRFKPPGGVRIMSPYQYWPFSGMHFSFVPEALPALYFPLSGTGSRYDRFDDVWCGVLLQKVFRHCGLLCSIGEPFVYHSRRSDPIANLRKEAPGIEAHERFWQIIDQFELPDNQPLRATMAAAASALRGVAGEDYLNQWGMALSVWLELCDTAMAQGMETLAADPFDDDVEPVSAAAHPGRASPELLELPAGTPVPQDEGLVPGG
jgi:hypothetical protein